MTFRQQYKNRRLLKRSRRLKGAPKWMDSIPAETPRKNTYKIAAKHQRNFSRAFLKAVRGFLPDRMPLGFKAAYRQQSPMQVEDVIFGIEYGSQDFIQNISSAYEAVLQDSGSVTMKELNRDFDTNFLFETQIEKQENIGTDGVPTVPVVPVNPYSIKWMRTRSLDLVKDLSEQQRKVIQTMLADGFEKGIRAEEVYDRIKANIGLTGRDSKAVLNRRALLEEKGFPEDKIEKQVNKYRDQLLAKRAERIARTETIAADAAGRRQAWQLAEESGSLPKVERVWISAPASPNPNRPCEICLELDGTAAPINGTYESSFVGPVSGPGPEVHPSCVIGDTLVVARGIKAASKRRYDGDLIILRTTLNNRLVCTPNHPILTPGGWVAANTLNVGSGVISYAGVQNEPFCFIDDNHKDVPVVVDEISNLIDKFDFSFAIPVPITAKDFHGDGIGSNIAIIKSNSLLRDTRYSSLLKLFYKAQFFGCSRCKLFLHRLCFSDFLRNRNNAPFSGNISGSSLSPSLFWRILRKFQDFRFTLTSSSHSVLQENSPNDAAASSPFFGRSILAKFPGSVVVDNVVAVDVQSASTHVYNLHTKDNYYIAQNIFSHNCRCSETLVRV